MMWPRGAFARGRSATTPARPPLACAPRRGGLSGPRLLRQRGAPSWPRLRRRSGACSPRRRAPRCCTSGSRTTSRRRSRRAPCPCCRWRCPAATAVAKTTAFSRRCAATTPAPWSSCCGGATRRTSTGTAPAGGRCTSRSRPRSRRVTQATPWPSCCCGTRRGQAGALGTAGRWTRRWSTPPSEAACRPSPCCCGTRGTLIRATCTAARCSMLSAGRRLTCAAPFTWRSPASCCGTAPAPAPWTRSA
mmetsp:Transcript_54463/g.141874  ORF Transcript_54463/g.141874 Transcript_54463/m.141874 type:complete len:247 (+) Transcript_54463:162-902(+)